MRFVIWLLIAVVVAGGAVTIAAMLRHPDERFPDNVYQLIFGAPDGGPVDFGALTRSSTSNDALACPPGRCGATKVDIETKPSAMTSQAIVDAIKAALAASGEGIAPNSDAIVNTRRTLSFVIRTPVMRFPDTLTIEIEDGGASRTVSLYSASQIGQSDLGANKARIERLAKAAGAL
jgi:uncharacterized protein (DUF1499 family)